MFSSMERMDYSRMNLAFSFSSRTSGSFWLEECASFKRVTFCPEMSKDYSATKFECLKCAKIRSISEEVSLS
jgi:hypothetical protein